MLHKNTCSKSKYKIKFTPGNIIKFCKGEPTFLLFIRKIEFIFTHFSLVGISKIEL